MKALVIDNDTDLIRYFLDCLEDLVGTTNVRHCPDPARAIKLFEADAYDIVFINLMLDPTSNVMSGIQIGARIRAKSEHAAIVMYSSDFTSGTEANHSQYAECIAAGADCVLARTRLSSFAPGSLERDIDKWIEERTKKIENDLTIEWGEDIRTKALIEVVGPGSITGILRGWLPNYKFHIIRGLKAGFSGSLVARVESRTTKVGGVSAKNILKLSRQSFPLADELKRSPGSGTSYSNLGRVPTGEIVVRDGWYALLIPEARDARSFENYLAEFTSVSNGRKKTLEYLFHKALVEPALETHEHLLDDAAAGFQLK